MDYADTLIKFLTEKRLMRNLQDNIPAFESILNDCLAVKSEKVLIISDWGVESKNVAAFMAAGYYKAATKIGLDTKLVMQGPKVRGDVANPEVIGSLNALDKGIVIMVLSNNLGKISVLGKSYRSYAKSKSYRYISTPNLGNLFNYDIPQVLDAINIDFIELRKKCAELKKILDGAKNIHVTTAKGTDLNIDVEGMMAVSNDGDYSQPEKGGNIPAGEVYIPPRGKDFVEGKAVIDVSAATRKGTTKIETPIELEIKKGSVVKISGNREARMLKESLTWARKNSKHPEDIGKIGEFGIGMNDKASVIGAMVVDEKLKGTAHIAIGSNNWFGGCIKGSLHLDLVFSNPKIEVDGKEIDISKF